MSKTPERPTSAPFRHQCGTVKDFGIKPVLSFIFEILAFGTKCINNDYPKLYFKHKNAFEFVFLEFSTLVWYFDIRNGTENGTQHDKSESFYFLLETLILL